MEFLDMNDDCLEHVLRFLDLKSVCNISDTCKHLSRIAAGIFRKQRYYKCHIGDEANVKEASEIIRKIGQYIITLDLDFEPIDTELYVENGIGCRFLQLLDHSLGEKFCELNLSGEISLFPVLKLAATLVKLQKLSIECEFDNSDLYYKKVYPVVSIDLPQLCPNLRELVIENCALIFAPNPIKLFPNLEVLEFHSFGEYYPIDSLECFFKQNKQLRKLYVDNLVNDNVGTFVDLAVVAKSLHVLEDMRIRTIVFHNWVQAMECFSQHNNLTTLVMSEYFDDVDDINGILDILKTMKQLKKIAIGWCMPSEIPNQQAIINVATELKQLESFQMDVQCDEHTIIECVRFGRSLKRFCVEFRSHRIVTTSFIKHLADVRKSVADPRLQPLLLYFAGVRLNGPVLKIMNEPKIARFVEWRVLENVGCNLFERSFT